ncbi:MAG TPA: RNA polymerase sigma-70 factor [Mycobacteriales bacterium]|nr:RNA polymerase sigma-70 factor [Mycobacteriales bacterium]
MTTDALEEFLALKPKLFGVAYRMLGSVADAEDVVQEAFLRWQATEREEVRVPEAFLTTVIVRLSLDALRSARARRETYVGPWLPEPLLVDDADPARAAELSDTLSMAFLVLLESLSPAERAAFLLREVFGYDYEDIAAMLDKAPAACRQLVTRARRHVEDRRQRYDADRHQGAELARRFTAACVSGDAAGVVALLTEDATLWTDGGGVVRAARRPIVGAAKIARFLVAVTPTLPPTAVARDAVVNGQPGQVLLDADEPIMAMALDVRDGRIVGIRVVSNPEKLTALRPRPAGGGPTQGGRG